MMQRTTAHCHISVPPARAPQGGGYTLGGDESLVLVVDIVCVCVCVCV